MRIAIPVLLCTCSLIVGLPARASADTKVYHGSQCRPTVMTASDEAVDAFGMTQATAAGPVSGRVAFSGYLDCPIVRDVVLNETGLQDVRVALVASAADPGDAECTLSSLSAQGAVLATQSRSTDTTATLAFGDTLNASGAYGYYHLFCRMPRNWTIARYEVSEYGAGSEGAQGAPAPTDAKYYNAAEWCFPTERTVRAQGGYFGYPPDGYTSRDPLTCPVLRDRDSEGMQDFDVELIGPGGSSATCTLYSVSADGGVVESMALSTSQQGPTTLDFGGSGHSVGSAAKGASAYLSCSFTDQKDWIIKGYRSVEARTAAAMMADAMTAASAASPVGDRKTYTGSFCRPNLLASFDKSYFSSVSGYYFQVAETPPVLCPLLRDVTSNDDGLAGIELWVAAPGQGAVGCGVYMLDAAGSIVGQASRGVEFGTDGGVAKIDFGAPGTALIAGPGKSADQGAFGIACSLPPGFAIIGYMIEEHLSGASN